MKDNIKHYITINQHFWNSPSLGFVMLDLKMECVAMNKNFSNWTKIENILFSFYSIVKQDDINYIDKIFRELTDNYSFEDKFIYLNSWNDSYEIRLLSVQCVDIENDKYLMLTFCKSTILNKINHSQTLSKQILDRVEEGILVIQPDLKIVFWNRFMEKFTGSSSNSVIGQNIIDAFPFLKDSKIEEHVRQLIEKKDVGAVEYQFDMPERNIKGWGICNFIGMYNSEGDVYQILVTSRDITEQKRLNELQIESEKKYRTIFNTSPDVIVISELNGNILDVNEGFCKLSGYTHEEVYRQSSLALKFWGSEEIRNCIIDRLLECGYINNIEHWFVKKTGEKRKGLLSAKIITLNQESHILTLIRDITDFQNIELELKNVKNEALDLLNKYKLITDNISDVIWIFDSRLMQFSFMSPSIEKLSGYLPEEVIFTNIHSFFREDSALMIVQAVPQRIDEFIKNGNQSERSYFELEINHKDGHLIWVEMTTQITMNNEGMLEVIGITRNIDERKKNELLIKESEMRYRAAFMTSPDGINITLNGVFVDVNDVFLTHMGYTKDEIIGKHSYDIPMWVKEDDRIKFIETLREKGFINNHETIMRHKSGRLLTVLMSAKVLMIKNEPHILSITHDITNRKIIETELVKAKEKAEESDRLKSAFLANMSHEIRTPMNAIKGFAELLTLPDLSDDKKIKFIEVINQRTDDLLMLINDLLDISKIEAGQMVITETKGNVVDLFSELESFFSSNKSLTTIELRTRIELKQSEQTIYCDFFRLNQILINLVNNALKFTKQGRVTVGCKLQDTNTILFYVEDTGIGIPEDKISVIFERFRQASDENTSKVYGGTGLGLSIVKGLTELMKGKVWCTSTEDKGSTFYVSLPFVQVLKSADADFKQVEQPVFYDWNDKTILVVEDDMYNIELIQEFLAPTFATCICANNGQKAIDLYRNTPHIDLILMDIQLPDISGYEVTRQIRALNADIPIIAQTAYAANSDRKAAIEAGCNDYISKPLNKSLLLQLIKKYF